MALWVCAGCGCRYAVGLPACPQCHGSEHREAEVPRITTWGGASIEQRPVAAHAAAVLGDAPATAELPGVRAPKADWVEHAVNVAGVPPEQAEAMTKTELVETVKAAVPAPPPVPPSPPRPPGS